MTQIIFLLSFICLYFYLISAYGTKLEYSHQIIATIIDGHVNNDSSDNYSDKHVLKLLDSINVRIISELVKNPTISSLSLAKRLDIPLSTLQRRRAKFENAILKRAYTFNYKAFDGRVGDLIIHVHKGKSEEVLKSFLRIIKIILHTAILELTHNIMFLLMLFTKILRSYTI